MARKNKHTKQRKRQKKGERKTVGDMSVKQLDKHINDVAIRSMKTKVQYFKDSLIEQNPSEGSGTAGTPVVFAIQPRGCDSLLPNFGTLTEGQRKIYVDFINVYCLFNENDLQVNDDKRNFIRHMFVKKDDETDASADDVRGMFTTMSGLSSRVEESLTSVIPRSKQIYAFQDSNWIPYDAIASQSVSTGVTPSTSLNYQYPFKKYKKVLKIQKEFQIRSNGTLVDWHIPTLALFFTGLATASPDCLMYYHMYYKVLD